MDRLLRRATPLVLLVLAGLAWFGKLLPGYDGLARRFGDDAVLRFVVGVLCVYMVLLVVERQRMEQHFKQVLGAFRDFHAGKGAERGTGDAQRQAIELLVGALESGKPEVRRTAAEQLQRLTGQPLGEDAAAWRAWLEQRGQGGPA